MSNITLNHNVAMVDGKQVLLTNQETALLKALIKGEGKTVSRDSLLKDAWGYQSAGITRTVDVHVQRLRRKIGMNLIDTVYKGGCKINTAPA